MAETQDSNWALPKFCFSVDLGGGMEKASFQEVSGLDIESPIKEYKHSDSSVFSTMKMPGLGRQNNITLKKGVIVKDSQFFDWYTNVKMNTVKRVTVTITILDEEGNPTMTWTLLNAWPSKVSSTDLKSDGNEVT